MGIDRIFARYLPAFTVEFVASLAGPQLSAVSPRLRD